LEKALMLADGSRRFADGRRRIASNIARLPELLGKADRD
jgi:hypothetical protein